jgi:translation initiation factor 5A
MSETIMATLNTLKKGKLVVIDGEPCRVTDVSSSAPGKHGHRKFRIVAISLSTGSKKNILGIPHMDIEVPRLLRKEAQVVAIMGEKAQLMDMTTYETYELVIPEEFKDKIQQGGMVEIEEVLDYRVISKIK